ncbi:P-loop containing nucleoside triphosphate hydrolase protein [Tribonema minus]|uniref:P-loop containing nucleoside triphosphate hydrolase protein n=1 Tax=Tribonema minus TaxID=303371 RepID=A0A835ZGG0_9STRA|nr:P-loop containing nucleoside triphosphate hydrolase protein [Tribonema minus]
MAKDTEDLCSLTDCSGEAVFDRLCNRYLRHKPYTSVGGTLLVAFNPYEWLDIYRNELDYMRGKAMPAHVYKISAKAYLNLATSGGKDQCILVNGVAGSGKTETAKLVRRHLTTLAAEANAAALSNSAAAATRRELLEASTLLLEAFCNAATTSNANSSRAGVTTELLFEGGRAPRLVGSRIRTYLLEETRVAAHSEGEGTFHILHLLADAACAGGGLEGGQGQGEGEGEGGVGLRLGGLQMGELVPGQLPYVGTPWLAAENRCTKASDALAAVLSALEAIGLADAQTDDLLRALAGLLHLGRINFNSPDEGAAHHMVSPDGCSIAPNSKVPPDGCSVVLESKETVTIAAELLGLDPLLLSAALTRRRIKVRGESVEVPYAPVEAAAARDALARLIYATALSSVVAHINAATSAKGRRRAGSRRTISVVDMFGFESTAHNEFEQLLINFASEKLQQRYLDDVFRVRGVKCKEEGICYEQVKIRDNSALLAVLTGTLGVLPLLDQTSRLKRGDGAGFVSALRCQLEPYHPKLVCTDMARLTGRVSAQEFVVRHSAQRVAYDARAFVARNRNQGRRTVSAALRASTNAVVAAAEKLQKGQRTVSAALRASTNAVVATAEKLQKESLRVYEAELAAQEEGSSSRRNSFDAASHASGKTAKTGTSWGGGGGKDPKHPTVAGRFGCELNALCQRIADAQTQYVWCIRPNRACAPFELDATYVAKQLRCANIVQAAKVHQSAGEYMSFADFFKAFKCITPAAVLFRGESLASSSSGDGDTSSDNSVAVGAGYDGALLRGMCLAMLEHLLEVDPADLAPRTSVQRRGRLFAAAGVVAAPFRPPLKLGKQIPSIRRPQAGRAQHQPQPLNRCEAPVFTIPTVAAATAGGDALKLPVVPKALGREFRAGSFMDANPRTSGNDARHSRNASYGGYKSSDISPAEQLTAAQQGAQQQQQQRAAAELRSTAQQMSTRQRSAQVDAWQQQRSTQVGAQQKQQQQQQQQRSTQVSAQQQQGQQQRQQQQQQQQRSTRPAPRAPQHGRPYVSPIASVRSDSEEKSEEPEGALSVNFNTNLNLLGRQERGLLAMMMVPMGTIGVLECTVERSRRSALALRQPKYSVYSQFNRRLIMTAKRSAFSGNVTICVVGCLPAALGTFTLRCAIANRLYLLTRNRPRIGPAGKRLSGKAADEAVCAVAVHAYQHQNSQGSRCIEVVIPRVAMAPKALASLVAPHSNVQTPELTVIRPAKTQHGRELLVDGHRSLVRGTANIVLRGDDGALHMQFLQVSESNFILDVQRPMAPLMAFAAAMANTCSAL